jgi:hypothetical protein
MRLQPYATMRVPRAAKPLGTGRSRVRRRCSGRPSVQKDLDHCVVLGTPGFRLSIKRRGSGGCGKRRAQGAVALAGPEPACPAAAQRDLPAVGDMEQAPRLQQARPGQPGPLENANSRCSRGRRRSRRAASNSAHEIRQRRAGRAAAGWPIGARHPRTCLLRRTSCRSCRLPAGSRPG